MRKTLVIVVASSALIALAPATALAKRHHHRSHSHHARAHHRIFISDQGSSSNQGTTGTAPTGTAPSPGGTVVSFTNGVLTIKASDGSAASGMVTGATELKCEAPDSTSMQSHDHGQSGGGGDENGGNNDNNAGNDNNDNGDNGDNDDNGANQTCTTADLAPGTPVQEAELTISSAGAVWSKVELVTPSTTTPGS